MESQLKHQNNSKVFEVSVNNSNFFLEWVRITTPLHRVEAKDETKVFAELLRYYNYILSITGQKESADSILSSSELRNDIIKELKISQGHFNTCLTRLRQKGVISDNKINPKYIIPVGTTTLSLTIQLNLEING